LYIWNYIPPSISYFYGKERNISNGDNFFLNMGKGEPTMRRINDTLRQSCGRDSSRKSLHGLLASEGNYGRAMKRVVLQVLMASMIIAASFNFSGCFWVAAGGAGVVGYKMGTDERSVGTQIDDAAITTKINAKLVAEPGIRSLNIDVDTLDGNVTLSGYVQSEEQIQRILSLARSVGGVKSVISNLKVRGR
jgi:hyperosmotically inducible protein